MIGPHDTQDRELVTLLQRGLPIVARPFDQVGQALGLDGDAVVARANALLEAGTARRFGAVFDSTSLGYKSTLCAVDCPEADLDRVAALLAPDPGITHCYSRQGHPNLWFTLTALADRFEATLGQIAAALAPYTLLDLPATRRFKIQAVFDMREGDHGNREPHTPAPRKRSPVGAAPLSASDQQVVRALQGNLPLSRDPFRDLAESLDMELESLLALLSQWQHDGILRRVGLIMRHTRLGFRANGMCVWPVEADRVEAAGQIMAAHREVSHCYERPYSDAFPFNLYAMVHASDSDALTRCFEQLTAEAGLAAGRIMVSVREFKKSSPVFFCEPAGQGEG